MSSVKRGIGRQKAQFSLLRDYNLRDLIHLTSARS